MIIDARVWFIAFLCVLLFSILNGLEMPADDVNKSTPVVEVVASDVVVEVLSEEQLAHEAWEESYGNMSEQELLKGVVYEPIEQ